jgi:hypothetical protein
MSNSHEEFIAVDASAIEWTKNPEVPGIESAVLVGNPLEEERYLIRIKLPPLIRIELHTHDEGRLYTVLEGEWLIGFPSPEDYRRSFTAGSVYFLPAKLAHYQESGIGGAVIQIEGMGPSTTDFCTTEKWAFVRRD